MSYKHCGYKLMAIGIIAIGIIGCLPLKKLSYSAPVKPGENLNKLVDVWGQPDRNFAFVAVYPDSGMIAFHSKNQPKMIDSLVFSYFYKGEHYVGEIFGIALGDTYPKCVILWGEPDKRSIKDSYIYVLTWKFKNYIVQVEFWQEGGYDEVYGGNYEKDTARRIKVWET